MTVKITVTMVDDGVDPQLQGTAVVDSPGVAEIVRLATVDRALLQSYLMLAVQPLADDYDRQQPA